MIEETICDLCGDSSFIPVFDSNINPQEKGYRYFSSSRQKSGHWPIVKCKTCGLRRSNPRDSQASLLAIYARLEDNIYDKEEENRSFIAMNRIKEILLQKTAGKLLDIGCSTGVFASQASKLGWNVTGVDPSQWAIKQANNRCPHGKFLCSTIEEAKFQNETFDLITLWDVLEHVISPSQILSKINPWLAHDGLLVMNIPNVDSFSAKIMGKNWVLFLREHLWYFSPRTITQLLQKTGYEIISVNPNKVRFSIQNILTRISQYPGLKFINQFSRFPGMEKISLNFSIGEMQVYARKNF